MLFRHVVETASPGSCSYKYGMDDVEGSMLSFIEIRQVVCIQGLGYTTARLFDDAKESIRFEADSSN